MSIKQLFLVGAFTLASFCVEAFSLERLRSLTREEIDARYEVFRLMSQFEITA